MSNPKLRQAVSQSLQQANFQAERRWNGLCVSCCLALNLPLSLENLGAVKASLLLTFAQQSREASSGETTASLEAVWSTFAQKALADLKRDSGRMSVRMGWTWGNVLLSSLTRLIYLNQRMRQRSRVRSSTGSRRLGRSMRLSSILSARLLLEEMKTLVRTWVSSSATASSSTERPGHLSYSSTIPARTRRAEPAAGRTPRCG